MSLEVLSPAGSMEALVAAIRCGADAVYLGLDRFNARQNANNFTDDEFIEAISLCKKSGVKAYLVLNTIIKENELNDAVSAADFAAKSGVSAVIIQDLGLAAELRRVLPELPLHASTQMSVHSPSALIPLKEMGFKRVVLAREMTGKELAIFCKEAKKLEIEVEIFVHGALCMSVSGQCYLSASLGGRSANRGLCAGTCRLPFGVKGGTGYDLSLKDLSLASHIKELREMGICSLKIEGRMKRPEYVAVSTTVFRSAVDEGKVRDDLAFLLNDVFSRSGFTDGYFAGKMGRQMFGIRTEENAAASTSAFRKIHELYRRERSSVLVIAHLTVKNGQPVTLLISDGVNTVMVSGENPQAAQNRALTEDLAKLQLEKLGGTVYYLSAFTCEIDENLAVSSGELGNLRRNAVEKLDAERSKPQNMPDVSYTHISQKANHPARQEIFLRLQTIDQLPDELGGLSSVSLPVDFWNKKRKPIPDIRWVAEIPRGMNNEVELEMALLKAKANGFTAALCGNLAAFSLAKRAGMQIISSFGMNVFNSCSLRSVKELGASGAVLSPELSASALQFISGDIGKGVLCYGRLPLMLTRNCPLKNGAGCANCPGTLSDRTGRVFPVVCQNGYSELLNSYPLWMADRLENLSTADFLVFYFTTETKEEVQKVLNDYENKTTATTDFTRGLYRTGVK